MYSTPLPVDITHITNNADFRRLVEALNKTHLPRAIKQADKTVAVLFPGDINTQEIASPKAHNPAFAGRNNVIDLNHEEDMDTVSSRLSQPSDISALLAMSGSIVDAAEDVSSDKKKYIYS